jgi:hypothetical protein
MPPGKVKKLDLYEEMKKELGNRAEETWKDSMQSSSGRGSRVSA